MRRPPQSLLSYCFWGKRIEYRRSGKYRHIKIKRIYDSGNPIGWKARGKHPKAIFLMAIEMIEKFMFEEEYPLFIKKINKTKGMLKLIVGEDFERITNCFSENGFNEIREGKYKSILFPWARGNPNVVAVPHDEEINDRSEPGPPVVGSPP